MRLHSPFRAVVLLCMALQCFVWEAHGVVDMYETRVGREMGRVRRDTSNLGIPTVADCNFAVGNSCHLNEARLDCSSAMSACPLRTECIALACNGVCDSRCLNVHCNYDNGACSEALNTTASTPTPPPHVAWDNCPAILRAHCQLRFADGHCDAECRDADCLWDGFDCLEWSPASMAEPSWVACPNVTYCQQRYGDGVCDPLCNLAACLYDGGDCAAADDPWLACAEADFCRARYNDGTCTPEELSRCGNSDCPTDPTCATVDDWQPLGACPSHDLCATLSHSDTCLAACNAPACGWAAGACDVAASREAPVPLAVVLAMSPQTFMHAIGDFRVHFGRLLGGPVHVWNVVTFLPDAAALDTYLRNGSGFAGDTLRMLTTSNASSTHETLVMFNVTLTDATSQLASSLDMQNFLNAAYSSGVLTQANAGFPLSHAFSLLPSDLSLSGQWTQARAPSSASSGVGSATVVGSVVGALVACILALFLVVGMLKRSRKAAFGGDGRRITSQSALYNSNDNDDYDAYSEDTQELIMNEVSSSSSPDGVRGSINGGGSGGGGLRARFRKRSRVDTPENASLRTSLMSSAPLPLPSSAGLRAAVEAAAGPSDTAFMQMLHGNDFEAFLDHSTALSPSPKRPSLSHSGDIDHPHFNLSDDERVSDATDDGSSSYDTLLVGGPQHQEAGSAMLVEESEIDTSSLRPTPILLSSPTPTRHSDPTTTATSATTAAASAIGATPLSASTSVSISRDTLSTHSATSSTSHQPNIKTNLATGVLSAKDAETARRNRLLIEDQQRRVRERHARELLHAVRVNDADSIAKKYLQGSGTSAPPDGKQSFVFAQLYHDATSMLTETGWTPLHTACHYGNADVVRVLLGGRVNPNVPARDGRTALHVAAAHGHADCIHELLCVPSIKVNQRCRHGSTALHEACRLGDVHGIDQLLQAGININTATRDGETATMAALKLGNAVCAMRLLRAGANPCLRDDKMWTALHWASALGLFPCARHIAQMSSMDINGRTSHGNTSLHLAAREGHADVVRILLMRFAVRDVENDDQKTPMMLAVERHHPDVVSLLNDWSLSLTTQNGSSPPPPSATNSNSGSAGGSVKATNTTTTTASSSTRPRQHARKGSDDNRSSARHSVLSNSTVTSSSTDTAEYAEATATTALTLKREPEEETSALSPQLLSPGGGDVYESASMASTMLDRSPAGPTACGEDFHSGASTTSSMSPPHSTLLVRRIMPQSPTHPLVLHADTNSENLVFAEGPSPSTSLDDHDVPGSDVALNITEGDSSDHIDQILNFFDANPVETFI